MMNELKGETYTDIEVELIIRKIDGSIKEIEKTRWRIGNGHDD